MAQISIVLKPRRGSAIDPVTVADVCLGIATISRHTKIEVSGELYEVRAKVYRVQRGSLKFIFKLEPLISSSDIRTAAIAVVSTLAATAIIAAFRWLWNQSSMARAAQAEGVARIIDSPQVVGALARVVTALQRDGAVASVKVEDSSEAVRFNYDEIERASQFLAEHQWGRPRNEDFLWVKHVRIVGLRGSEESAEWRIHWDKGGVAQEAWVRAVRPPSNVRWTPAANRTLVVDLKSTLRSEPQGNVIEDVEILNVHWREAA